MAQKCAGCGSADTTTGAGSISCLSCGGQTAVGPVEFAPNTVPVTAPAPAPKVSPVKPGGSSKAPSKKKG